MEERNAAYESQKNDGMRINPLKVKLKFGGSNDNKDPNPVQGFILAIILGIVAAVFWAIVVKVTGYNLGIAAIAVGFLVSQGFVWAGKSNSAVWGIVAAVIATLSILLGKLLVVVLLLSEFYSVSILEMIPLIDYSQMFMFVMDDFELFDFVFYVIALQTAYKRSFNKTNTNYGDFMKQSKSEAHANASEGSYTSTNKSQETSSEYEESPERSKQPMATPESEAR